ncbi:MAG: DUF835 domain-containing protein [Candidatus Thermoplasmatota archaeon]
MLVDLAGLGRPHQMTEGTIYLVKERKPLLSFKLFEIMLDDGLPGLCITRQYPEKVRARSREIGKTQIIWLSQTPGDHHHNPTSIGTLASMIVNFIHAKGECAILLDGLEYLYMNNGFPQLLRFIEHVNEKIMSSRAVLIIPVCPDAFDPKEMALIERNMEVIESPLIQLGAPKPSPDLSALMDEY